MKLKNIIILGTLATATISHAAITAGVNIGNADNANNLLNSRAAGDREAGNRISRHDLLAGEGLRRNAGKRCRQQLVYDGTDHVSG